MDKAIYKRNSNCTIFTRELGTHTTLIAVITSYCHICLTLAWSMNSHNPLAFSFRNTILSSVKTL
jgi:hypothetical protein